MSRLDRELFDAQEIAGDLVAPGSVFAFLAEHRRELFDDSFTADLFASGTGRPSLPADLVGAVLVLKELYGLSDGQTADALMFDIRWKVACGRSLTAMSFHPSTLVYWRKRIAASDRPDRVFDKIAEVVAETGILTGRRKRCVDSTVFDDAVATQDTVTQLVAAIRKVARTVPGAWGVVEAVCTLDYAKPGKPDIDWDDVAAKQELVSTLVNDALAVLAELCGPGAPQRDGAAADALGLLALVAGQDVEPASGSDGTDGRWVIARRVAPDRVVSTVDRQARHTRKSRSKRTDGYRAHVATEPDTGLVTDCEMTMATGEDNTDAAMGVKMAQRDRYHTTTDTGDSTDAGTTAATTDRTDTTTHSADTAGTATTDDADQNAATDTTTDSDSDTTSDAEQAAATGTADSTDPGATDSGTPDDTDQTATTADTTTADAEQTAATDTTTDSDSDTTSDAEQTAATGTADSTDPGATDSGTPDDTDQTATTADTTTADTEQASGVTSQTSAAAGSTSGDIAPAQAGAGAGSGLQMYGDSAYGSGAARAAYRDAGHDTMIKPKPLTPAVSGGFTLDDFTITDHDVTCPAGWTRPLSPTRTVTFGRLCATCPLRARCTTAKNGRSMTIHEHEDLLRAARAQARTPQFKRDYPPVPTSNAPSPTPPPKTDDASSSATSAPPRTTPGSTTGSPP